ncbi:MAG TPA: metal-dependent hydrolase [Gemmatimonadaceae bacterium]|nr:metal-dependent hydrolase [Gemmatimonadaceae bacterium]
MIIGHLGVALGARAIRKETPFAWLVAATYAPDVVDYVVGLSGVCLNNGVYSHSIPAIAALCLVLGAGARWETRSARVGITVAVLVVLHLLADLLTGHKTLWPGTHAVGLDLYSVPLADFVLESAVIIAGWALLRRARGTPRWTTAWVTLAVLLLLQAGGNASSDNAPYKKPDACLES